MKIKGLILMALLFTPPVYADVYRWTDANGVMHFSDKPEPGAQKIEISPPQTVSNLPEQSPSADPAFSKPSQPQNAEGSEGGFTYESVVITQPENEETIRNPQGDVPIAIQVKPELRPQDKLQLIFDGAPLGDPQMTPLFSLHGINRGQHTLLVQLQDSTGTVLLESDPVVIFMQQPRVNMGKTHIPNP